MYVLLKLQQTVTDRSFSLGEKEQLYSRQKKKKMNKISIGPTKKEFISSNINLYGL